MQIHELNSFVGTPGAGDYLAIDDGSETTKVEASNLGVTTQMTQAEAEAGTETAPRVVAPSIFKSAVVAIASAISGVFVSMTNPKYTLDTSAASGDDYNLTQALASLGWLSDVVTSGVLGVKKLLYKMLTELSPLVTNEGWMNVYNNYCQVKRRGKVVTVVGYSAGGGITLTAGDYKSITTLPSQFRPTHATYFSVTANGGTQTIFGTIEPSTGLVKLYSSGATSYWAYCVTYIID